MFGVLDLDDPPRIEAASHAAPAHLQLLPRPTHRERHRCFQLTDLGGKLVVRSNVVLSSSPILKSLTRKIIIIPLIIVCFTRGHIPLLKIGDLEILKLLTAKRPTMHFLCASSVYKLRRLLTIMWSDSSPICTSKFKRILHIVYTESSLKLKP